MYLKKSHRVVVRCFVKHNKQCFRPWMLRIGVNHKKGNSNTITEASNLGTAKLVEKQPFSPAKHQQNENIEGKNF